ncbi:hypothetical protein J437_LFUL017708 [Ladona fulva]|uniref:Helix-turn-helix domain-containing protein n=1 Tax=Ladona fulva TaxID=123851 RepID=A0A8K0KPU5_LADFU|nr:hypothetical protein J437_LFUL017708 [Ladona fulva]
MELEENGCIPFLDVMVKRRSDGTLGHSVYRKPTHTDRYLHASYHHHPRQKSAVIKTLFHRARSIADDETYGQEENIMILPEFREYGLKHGIAPYYLLEISAYYRAHQADELFHAYVLADNRWTTMSS